MYKNHVKWEKKYAKATIAEIWKQGNTPLDADFGFGEIIGFLREDGIIC